MKVGLKCEICGIHDASKEWFLEPKHTENSKSIKVCKLCYEDLVMIRRWRRHGR